MIGAPAGGAISFFSAFSSLRRLILLFFYWSKYSYIGDDSTCIFISSCSTILFLNPYLTHAACKLPAIQMVWDTNWSEAWKSEWNYFVEFFSVRCATQTEMDKLKNVSCSLTARIDSYVFRFCLGWYRWSNFCD